MRDLVSVEHLFCGERGSCAAFHSVGGRRVALGAGTLTGQKS
jgi:hypothetical protein